MPVLQLYNDTINSIFERRRREMLDNCNAESVKFIFLGPIGIFIFVLFACCCCCKICDMWKSRNTPLDMEPIIGLERTTNWKTQSGTTIDPTLFIKAEKFGRALDAGQFPPKYSILDPRSEDNF